MKLIYKALLSFTVAATTFATSFADVPAGYYSSCEGKSKSALKSQLYTILSDHTAIAYGSGSSSTWWAFRYTDVSDDGYWMDVYTNARVAASSGTSAASSMNIEHSFPKSWWGGTKNNAYKDIVHLMPVNSVANSTRGNWPFAEVATAKSISANCPSPTFRYGSPVSGQGGGSGTVFEPADEYKGDLARTYFYMVTCYQNLSWSADGLKTAQQGSYPTLQPWAQEMLLRWHREDPVSQKERDRNEGVWQCQKNRNPFIDHPEMVEHIWGNLTDQAWHSGETPVDPDPVDPDPGLIDPNPAEAVLTSPRQGATYDCGDVAPDSETVIEIPVLGTGFTHSLTAKLSGTDAAQFSFLVGAMKLPAVTITKSDINDADGYFLRLRYAPTEYTDPELPHTATVTISGQDLATPVAVTVTGSADAPFEVEAPVALEADAVEEDMYTARWLPTTQDVDYYTIYRDIYDETGSEIVISEDYDVAPEATFYVIEDRMIDCRERYSVTATVRGRESARSNYIFVDAFSSVDTLDASDGDAGSWYTPDGIRLPGRPAESGIYIHRTATRSTRHVIP